MAHYPDLETGRFAVIADFENPGQFEIFQMETASPAGELSLMLEGGVIPTGGRCLQVRLTEQADAVLAANTGSEKWSLKRDWRDYNLLMMSVYCPIEGVELEIAMKAGSEASPVTKYTRHSMNRGWNELRLDLREIAEHLPMDSVRELRWSMPQLQVPVELRLDDIILVDNRKDLCGSSTDQNGRLYVQRDGRHWNVGCVGRFELGFFNGQIVRWFDLANDPNRLTNLVAGNVMGPTPVILAEGRGRQIHDFSVFGTRVRAGQRIEEMSPQRVVLSCDWRFMMEGGDAAQNPGQRWTYTIYPSGQIYVHVECDTKFGPQRAARVGLAVTRTGSDLEAVASGSAGSADGEASPAVCYGYTQPARLDGAALLWALHDRSETATMEALRDGERNRVVLVASGDTTTDATRTWDGMLSVWPPDQVLGTGAMERALDYCHPAALQPAVGRLVRDEAADEDGDGFLERMGCYELAPDSDRVRWRMGASQGKRHWPTVLIRESAERRAWVYVDSLILDEQGRDTEGNVFFQIPKVLEKDTLIEVYLTAP